MTYDASLRKDVRRMEKESAQAEANRIAYTKTIMRDRFGRRWMYDLLLRCHIWSTPFAMGQPDGTAFRLGEQNIGLQVFADVMKAAPDDYVLMMNEASEKDIINERRNRDNRTAPDELAGDEDTGRHHEGSILTEYDPTAADPDA